MTKAVKRPGILTTLAVVSTWLKEGFAFPHLYFGGALFQIRTVGLIAESVPACFLPPVYGGASFGVSSIEYVCSTRTYTWKTPLVLRDVKHIDTLFRVSAPSGWLGGLHKMKPI